METIKAVERAVTLGVGCRGQINISELVDLISPEPPIPRQMVRDAIANLLYSGVLEMDQTRCLRLVGEAAENA